MFSRRAVYANLRDVFINSPPATARARAETDKEGKKRTKKGRRARNGGARSRRIIKCVLPRKFIFILESIIRKRRHARAREKDLPFFSLRETLASLRGSSRYEIATLYSLSVYFFLLSLLYSDYAKRAKSREDTSSTIATAL